MSAESSETIELQISQEIIPTVSVTTQDINDCHVDNQQIGSQSISTNDGIVSTQASNALTEGAVVSEEVGDLGTLVALTANRNNELNENTVCEKTDSKRKCFFDKKKALKGHKKSKRSHDENDDDPEAVHIEELSLKEEESDGEYNWCEYKGYVMEISPKEFKKRVFSAVEEWALSLDQAEDTVETQQCPHDGCEELIPEGEFSIHCDSHVMGSTVFKCPDKDCQLENESWVDMRGHITKHRGKFTLGNWKCDQDGCSQYFTRKLHLKRHVMFKHFYENIAKSLAQEYYPSTGGTENKIKKIQPPQSLRKFKKRSKIKKEKKSAKKYLRCIKCNAVFKTMDDVDAHLERHIIRIKCTECEGYFDDDTLLKTHVKENHSRMLHTNRCQLCSYSCLNSADLKTHMYSHENTVFECDLCGRVCANPKTLKSHRMRKHPDLFQNKGLVCIYCRMVFANDVLLQDHIRNKHKMRLNGQRRINRREELKFPCNHCGFVANRQSSLQYHMRVHLENRPYKCTHCPYASKTRNNLILHIRTHKALAPLECPHCEFRGATNKVIQQHITSKHTNERPYKCTVCPWSTCYSGNLWKHMKMHKEKDGIEIPESTRKRTPRARKANPLPSLITKAATLSGTIPVSIYEGHIQVQQQQQQQQPQQHQQHMHIQQQQSTHHIIHGGHQEVIQMQPRVHVQTQHQTENSMPQFAQVVLQTEAPQHHQTVEIQIHGGEAGSMVIPRHADDEMAAETVQQLVNLANMLPVSSSEHVMHTMQPAHAQ